MQRFCRILYLVVLLFSSTCIVAQEEVLQRVSEIKNYLQDKTEWNTEDSILCYIALSSIYMMRGQEDSALYFLVDAEMLSESLTEGDEKHAVVGSIYMGYSTLTHEINEVLYWLLKAEFEYKDLYDGKYSLYAKIIANIADSYIKLGDKRNTLLYANKYIEFYNSYLKTEENTSIATELSLIAECYEFLEKYDEAILYMDKAIEMGIKILGEKHLFVCENMRILSRIYANYGKYDEAEEILINAIEYLSEKGPEFSCSLNIWKMDLSEYYLRNHKIIPSVELLLSVAPQIIECDGESPSLLMLIARACWVTNNSDKIFPYINRCFQLKKQETLLSLGHTFSRYKSKMIPDMLWQTIYEYIIDSIQNTQMDSLAYEVRLFSNGLHRNSETLAQHYYSIEKAESLISKNGILAEYELMQDFSDEHYNKLANLSNIGLVHIKKSITNDEIAIELVKSVLCGGAKLEKGKEKYFALVFRKDWNAPRCVILGEEEKLEKMSYPKLQQAVWQAIIDSAQIKEGENIYFAPDGIFYNTPIEYLPTADGRNMSDVYNMFRVSSTRELCFRDSTNPKYSSAVLFGGLKYDAAPQQNLYAQNLSGYRGLDNMSETVWTQWRAEDRAKYNYLPYTLKEVDSISTTIHNALQVTTYTDVYGDEKSFKALSCTSPSILHIATHGYYITPTQAEIMSRERLLKYGVSPMDEQQSVIDYSMERTGLLLAGAQYTLRGDSLPEDADDGILSAKEISHLDLTNTDLVVLSACQTALGDITNDGVAGLQRGFKIAGVKSILMSLWKVDDAATYLLMKQFYKSLVAGNSKQQALRDAQNYLRSYMVGNERPYNDIHYWGAFVLLDAIE